MQIEKEKEEQARPKTTKAEKRWRNKINKIAKAEGIQPYLIEKRLKKEEEDKIKAELIVSKEQEGTYELVETVEVE